MGFLLLLLVINGLLALIPASVAANKGRSFGLWWTYGFVLFLVALVHALLAEDANRVPCPHCAESIRPEASLCPHCRMPIEPRSQGSSGDLRDGSDDALAVVSPELATNHSNREVLWFIAECDGNLEAVVERAGGDVAEAAQSMIDDGLLVATSWDQVALTDHGRDVLAAPPPSMEPATPSAMAQSDPDTQGGPEGRDVGQTTRNQARVGDDIAVWDDERFELQRSNGDEHVVELLDVVTIGVDKGVADAWIIFHRQDADPLTVPIPRSAVQDAHLVATQLQTLVAQRETPD